MNYDKYLILSIIRSNLFNRLQTFYHYSLWTIKLIFVCNDKEKDRDKIRDRIKNI